MENPHALIISSRRQLARVANDQHLHGLGVHQIPQKIGIDHPSVFLTIDTIQI